MISNILKYFDIDSKSSLLINIAAPSFFIINSLHPFRPFLYFSESGEYTRSLLYVMSNLACVPTALF